MAARTYREHVIVLRRTKLREADVVLTLLAEDGRQVRAVAKGALKPGGSFASRLELFAEADVLLVQGRTLDIVKEARLLDGHAALRFDFDRSMSAMPVAELLARCTQDALPVARLFPMTQAALRAIESLEGLRTPLATCAFLLKASSLLGFRPSLRACAECGQPRVPGEPVAFSFAAGGILCAECALPQQGADVPVYAVDWADALLHATFEQMGKMDVDVPTLKGIMRFSQAWVEAHLVPLKSLPQLLAALE